MGHDNLRRSIPDMPAEWSNDFWSAVEPRVPWWRKTLNRIRRFFR